MKEKRKKREDQRERGKKRERIVFLMRKERDKE